MKPRLIKIYTAIFTIALLASACHKCVECTEYLPNGGEAIIWPEICGKKDEIKEYRKFMEDGANPQNKVQCKERKTTLF
ncbi:MAG: hypothetical protein LC111_09655 [Bacteroidia bacterium]|nr:hypothetical protein [Bacteroidia bacterium]